MSSVPPAQSLSKSDESRRFILRPWSHTCFQKYVYDTHGLQPRSGPMNEYDAYLLAKELEATAPPFKIQIARYNPLPRFETRPAGGGQLEVWDAVESRVMGVFFTDIARECCDKLSACRCANRRSRKSRIIRWPVAACSRE